MSHRPDRVRKLFVAGLMVALHGPLAWAQPASDRLPAEATLRFDAEGPRRLLPRVRFHPVIDPLPSLAITGLTQDAKGFLWVATQNGLGRWNGRQMTVFRAREGKKKGGLPSSYASAITADGAGDVWVGTYDRGVARFSYRDGSWETWDTEDRLSSPSVTALHADGEGQMWVGHATGTVDRISVDSGSVTAVVEPGYIDAEITSIRSTQDGSVWLASKDGLHRFQNGVLDSYRHDPFVEGSLPAQELNDVLVDDGRVWVATAGRGVFVASTRDMRFELVREGSEGAHALVLERGPEGSVWVGTRVGLEQHLPDGSFQLYQRDEKDPASESFPPWTSELLFDGRGILWLAGFGHGLRKLDFHESQFGPLHLDRLTSPVFAEETPGTVWIGTPTRGLYRVDFEGDRVRRYPTFRVGGTTRRLLGTWITAVHHSSRIGLPGRRRPSSRAGNVFFSTEAHGILGLDAGTGTGRAIPVDVVEEGLFDTLRVDDFVESDGTLFAASWGGGLLRYVPERGRFERVPVELPSAYLYDLEVAPDGRLWVGMAEGGVASIRPDPLELTVPDAVNASLPDQNVTSVRVEDGRLWMGTFGGGLVRWDPRSGALNSWGMEEGLPSDTVFSALRGDDGALWASTPRGLVRTRVEPDASLGPTRILGLADGLQGDEFNQSTHLAGSDGHLYFGGTRGGHRFRPSDLEWPDHRPQVHVMDFSIFQESVPLEEPVWTHPPVHLGYRDSVFSFEFVAPYGGNPNRLTYAYRLAGLSDSWIESDRTFATFTSLPGGNYDFQVRARIDGGTWSEPTTIPIGVDRPPWLRWWAFVIYGAIGALVALAFLRRQRAKLRAMQQAHRLQTVERELELTSAVQTGFLPTDDRFDDGRVRLQGYYRPADQCSGDWWYFEDDSDQTLSVLVGDVTGHGPGPAMVTAAAATAFRVSRSGDPLAQRLGAVHSEVQSVARGKYHMTMTAVQVDKRTGAFRLFSAAGMPAVIVKREGRPKTVTCRGVPLGFDGFEIAWTDGQLEPHDRLVLFTDGIPELETPKGRLLGVRGFSRWFEGARGDSLEGVVRHVVGRAEQMLNGAAQEDDWTFAIVEYVPSTPAAR